jgi:hypothetical protein
MRVSNLLPALRISALCLAVISPAISQDSIQVFKIIDFESSQIQSTLGVYGGTYADNSERNNDTVTYGNSLLTTFPMHEDPDSTLWVSGRNEESFTAMQMGYQLGTVMLGCGDKCEYPPHVGLSIGFSSEFDPIELTGATHVTFWAKGKDSLTLNVSLGMRDSVKYPAEYSQVFVIDTTWKKYSIELKPSTVFKLPAWVAPYPFDVVRVNSIGFSINKGENPVHADNALFLDDIEIVNWVLSFVSGINKQDRTAGRSHGLRARFTGDIALVQVPSAFLGKTGVIEALDATGRKIGQAAFGPQALDVSLKVPGASAKSTGLFFRAVRK